MQSDQSRTTFTENQIKYQSEEELAEGKKFLHYFYITQTQAVNNLGQELWSSPSPGLFGSQEAWCFLMGIKTGYWI